MKRTILTILAAAALSITTSATQADLTRVTELKVDRSTDRLLINMNIDADDLGRESNRESWLTPVLTELTEDSASVRSLRLPSIFVGGRSRYYQALRHGVDVPMYRGGVIPYAANVEWEQWMESSVLTLERNEQGCCGAPKGLTSVPIDTLDFVPRVFRPQFQYIRPEAEMVKERQLSGRAFIDFPVNKIEIYPEYRSNPRELAAIRATIDSVRLDPDVSVREMTFKGYASPEGPYNNNVRLAKGRTESLKNYVQSLYHFDPSVIRTSYEPEDWEGLRRFVETSGIENRDAILAVIDSDLAPDAKDNKLRRDFPVQYQFLLKEVYPGLRHTDYTIGYTIRSYNDPAEILRLVYTRPQNLSLNEFFVAAQSVEPGSEAFNYIFETAARMYPTDEVANLNAALAAMQQGAYDNAAAYIANAGDGADAIYARGVLAGLRGDYEEALGYLHQAARLKVAPAVDAIDQINEVISFNARVTGSVKN